MTAEEVRELRRTLAISQERLARELGVSLSTVQRWEKGAKPLPAKPVRVSVGKGGRSHENIKATTA